MPYKLCEGVEYAFRQVDFVTGTFYPNGPPYSMVNMVHLLSGIMRYAIPSLTFSLVSFFLPIPVRIQTDNTTSIGLALVENAGACCPRTAPERSGRRAIPKAEIPGVDFVFGCVPLRKGLHYF